VSGSKEV